MTVFVTILAIILFLIGLILLSKITVFLSFHDKFVFYVKFFGFKLFGNQEQDGKIEKSDDKTQGEKQKAKFFGKLRKKLGFSGAVKELSGFGMKIAKLLSSLLKHFSFRKIFLNIIVATENAAQTAIEYGTVCAVVYPLAEFLNSVSDVKYKKIAISTDFNSTNPKMEFEFEAGTRVIFLLISAFKIFKEYRNFISRNDL